MRVISKFAINIISKNLIILKILLMKIFEFSLYYQIFGFIVTFILILLLNYHFIKEQDGKKDIVRPISPNSFKVILILLTKMVIVYMQVFILEIRKSSF